MLTPLVLADTTLNVKTQKALQALAIRVKDVDTGAIVETVGVETDMNRTATATISTTRPEINLLILYVENSNVKDTKELGPYSTSGVINLDLTTNPEIWNDVDNSIKENTTQESTNNSNIEITQDENETHLTITENETQESTITGLAIFDSESTMNYIYIAIGAIVLIIIIFIIIKLVKRKSNPEQMQQSNTNPQGKEKLDKILDNMDEKEKSK